MIPYLSPGNKISPDAMSQLERLPFITRTGKLSTWFTISPSTKSQVPPLPNEKAGPPGLPESLGSGEVANPTYPASAPTTQQRARNLSLATGETPRVPTVPEGPAPDMSGSSSRCLTGGYYRGYQAGFWNLAALGWNASAYCSFTLSERTSSSGKWKFLGGLKEII